MKKRGKLTRQIIIKNWSAEKLIRVIRSGKWIEMRLNNINDKIFGYIILLTGKCKNEINKSRRTKI